MYTSVYIIHCFDKQTISEGHCGDLSDSSLEAVLGCWLHPGNKYLLIVLKKSPNGWFMRGSKQLDDRRCMKNLCKVLCIVICQYPIFKKFFWFDLIWYFDLSHQDHINHFTRIIVVVFPWLCVILMMLKLIIFYYLLEVDDKPLWPST